MSYAVLSEFSLEACLIVPASASRAPIGRDAWSLAGKQRLADRIAEFVSDIERTFWHGRDARESEREAATALGVLDSVRQRRVIAEVMNDEIVPALDAIGLDGTHMWSARTPGAESRGEAPHVLVAFEQTPRANESEALDAAAVWLASAIDGEGRLRFALDPRGEAHVHGFFQHGRAAIVLAALRSHGGFEAAAARLEAWLARELSAWQRGEAVLAWPSEAAGIAGTLALYALAGFAIEPLMRCAALGLTTRDPDSAWHGAQALSVLGSDPELESLWSLCVEDLSLRPWAPWTARAARARGDVGTLARCRAGLIDALGPHDEALAHSPIAVIAASLEALAATEPEASARDVELAATIARARGTLLAAQSFELEARGAFPISTTDRSLRSDVTAHALLALLATRSEDERGVRAEGQPLKRA